MNNNNDCYKHVEDSDELVPFDSQSNCAHSQMEVDRIRRFGSQLQIPKPHDLVRSIPTITKKVLPGLKNGDQEMQCLKVEFAKKQSIFPDALILKMFKEAGIKAEPLVVRSMGWMTQQTCLNYLQASLMLMNSRGEGRINHITKEVTYDLTEKIIEEVTRSKNFTKDP